MADADPGATHFYGDGCGEAHGSWANMEQAIEAERAAADAAAALFGDVADDLAHALDGIKGYATDSEWFDKAEQALTRYALARYREARGL